MTQEQITFILEEMLPVFQRWKETQVLKMTPEQNVEFRAVYLQEMGKPLPTCGNCVVEGMLSMIIRAEAQQKELNTLADDEQKPKRKRRKRIEKTHQDLSEGDELPSDGLDTL
jgi:hypothetical protein